MEREAMRGEAGFMGALQDIGGEFGLAAELARQRPFGAGAVAMNTADHAGPGGGAGDLVDLRLAVHRKQRDAELEGGGDLALLLDRVAVGDAVGGAAGGEHRFSLLHRGHVEGRAEPVQQAQDLPMRIGFDGVVDLGVGQRPGEGAVVVAHDVEVEHQAGPFLFAVLKELADAVGHCSCIPSVKALMAARVPGPARYPAAPG